MHGCSEDVSSSLTPSVSVFNLGCELETENSQHRSPLCDFDSSVRPQCLATLPWALAVGRREPDKITVVFLAVRLKGRR